MLNQNPLDKYMAKFSPATYSLITINIVIWLSMILLLNRFSNIKLLDMGGLVHFNVVHGEWYRLITSMFLHFNFEHILMNMLSLFIFGKIVEAIIGPMKMLILYIISGLFGNFYLCLLILILFQLVLVGQFWAYRCHNSNDDNK